MTAPTILDRIRLVRCLHRVPLCSLNRHLKRIKLTVNHHCVLDKVRHRLPHLSNPNNVATKIFHNRTARAVVVPTLNELVARQRKQLVPVKINMYSIHLPNLRHRPEQKRLHRQRVINYKLLQLKRVEPLPRGEFPVLTVARYYLDRPVPVYQVPVQNLVRSNINLTQLNSPKRVCRRRKDQNIQYPRHAVYQIDNRVLLARVSRHIILQVRIVLHIHRQPVRLVIKLGMRNKIIIRPVNTRLKPHNSAQTAILQHIQLDPIVIQLADVVRRHLDLANKHRALVNPRHLHLNNLPPLLYQPRVYRLKVKVAPILLRLRAKTRKLIPALQEHRHLKHQLQCINVL